MKNEFNAKKVLKPNEQGPWKSIQSQPNPNDERISKIIDKLFITQSQYPKLTNEDVDAELYEKHLDKDVAEI